MTKHLLPASTPTTKRTRGRTAQTAAVALASPRRRSSTRAAGDGGRGSEIAAFIDECEAQAMLFEAGPLAVALLRARVAILAVDRHAAWAAVTRELAHQVRVLADAPLDPAARSYVSEAPTLARLAATAAEHLVAARAELLANAVTK